MARAKDDTILVANQAFFHNGGYVPKGATVRAGHPILEGRELLFCPIELDYEVETTTRRGQHELTLGGAS
jgi:hypothetical protein